MENLKLSDLRVESLFTDGPEITEPETPTVETPVEPAVEVPETPAEPAEPTEPAVPETPAEEEETESMFQELQKRLGYEIEGEFNEDYDGLADFTKKMADKLVDQEFEAIAKAYPDVAQYIMFRENGGDPKEFFNSMIAEVDYEALEIKEDDVRSQEMVVSELLRKQGFTPEEIKETIEDYKDTGILFKQSVKARPKLAAAQATQRTAALEKQQKEQEARNAQVQQYWQDVQKTVQTGEVQGFVIPEADKRAFMEWMAKPIDKDGNTQRSIAKKQLSVEQIVAMDYLFFKGFDLNKLVQNKKSTQQANLLRDRLNKSTTGASVTRMKSGGQTSARGVKLPGLNELF